LDNSCGNGQFLFLVLERKIKNGASHLEALSTIFGCELDPKNAEECRKRLLKGSTSKKLRAIVDHNIICADALDSNHPGWATVGFYWDENNKPTNIINMFPVENGEVNTVLPSDKILLDEFGRNTSELSKYQDIFFKEYEESMRNFNTR
jgi:hypothetical protein